MDRFDVSCSQEEFGELVGISQQSVSSFVARGILIAGESQRAWLRAYCKQLRETAAGRSASNGLDLASERAMLAREQRERIAMQNAVTRRTLAPTHLIEEVLAKAGARAARILDTIPGALRRRSPGLSNDDLAAVGLIVAQARNIAAAVRLADLDVDIEVSEESDTDNALPDSIDHTAVAASSAGTVR